MPTEYNTELQCLKMSEENPYVDAYMAIIPGKIGRASCRERV